MLANFYYGRAHSKTKKKIVADDAKVQIYHAAILTI
jgi:hypothetical protein